MTIMPDPIYDGNQHKPDIKVSFGHTMEGLLAAQVHDTAFALLPDKNGSFTVASFSQPSRPIEQWKRSNFYSHGRSLANENEFRIYISEYAAHLRQLRTLPRQELSPGNSTPWGIADQAIHYGEQIIFYSTPSHGGFYLQPEDNTKIHPLLRCPNGWYEEDCEWAALAHAFPTLFTDYEKRHADETIRHWYPDAWQAIHQKTLKPGESLVHDRRQFEREHASDWIVITALTVKHLPGMVACLATRGGNRQSKDVRQYLISSQEYDPGRFGFVIDEARHMPCADDIWPRG